MPLELPAMEQERPQEEGLAEEGGGPWLLGTRTG